MITVWKRRFPPPILAHAGSHIWATRKNAHISGKKYIFTLDFIPFENTDRIWVFGKLKKGKITLTVTDNLGNTTKPVYFFNTQDYEDIKLNTELLKITLNQRAEIKLEIEQINPIDNFDLKDWGILYARASSGWKRRIISSIVWRGE